MRDSKFPGEKLIGLLGRYYRSLNGTPDDPALYAAWIKDMARSPGGTSAPDCHYDADAVSQIIEERGLLGIGEEFSAICLYQFGRIPVFPCFSPEEALVFLLHGGVPESVLKDRAEKCPDRCRRLFIRSGMGEAL